MDGYANRNCYIYNTVQTFRVIELFDFKSYFSNQGWFSSHCYITRQPECGSSCFQECSLDRGINNNSNSWNCVIYYMWDAVCFTNMSLFNPQDNPLDKYCYHKLRPVGRWHIWGHLRLEVWEQEPRLTWLQSRSGWSQTLVPVEYGVILTLAS